MDETADRDKEAWRDSRGVSKGKIKAECWAEANQEPGAGIRHPAHLSPQVCWHRQILIRGGKNTQKNCTKKNFTTQIIMKV